MPTSGELFALERVSRTRAELLDARTEYEAAMREAFRLGLPTYRIAIAAGMRPDAVRMYRGRLVRQRKNGRR